MHDRHILHEFFTGKNEEQQRRDRIINRCVAGMVTAMVVCFGLISWLLPI